MEFKIRSLQERSSTYYTPSPNLPSSSRMFHFTHQAVRAGNASPEMGRREVHRNPNDFREAMQFQRELEKERIRAEIIAEEIMRRRVLEEEVRREMMMEREMAMRFGYPGPMRFEPRVPLLTNFEHRERFGGIGVSPHREMGFRGYESRPFQRDPVASGSGAGNGTLSNATLQKIKGEPASEVAKDKVIFLAMPTVTAADLKRKAATQSDGPTAELISSGSKKQKTKDDWSCALCRVSATSERALNEHLMGKKHKVRERGLLTQKIGFGATPPKKAKTILNKSKVVKASRSESSPNFKNKDEKVGGGTGNVLAEKKENSVKKENQKTAMPKKTQVNAKPKKKFRHWCEVCKVGTNDVKAMDGHKKGKKHLATLYLNQTGGAKATTATTTPSKTSTENAVTEETKQENHGGTSGNQGRECQGCESIRNCL